MRHRLVPAGVAGNLSVTLDYLRILFTLRVHYFDWERCPRDWLDV